MNKKLLLQDLTDQLAETGRIKKKDAEEFLRVYFKVAEDALFEDGLIKIAGLGSLKLVKVEARKSVNVTTGEEFEIREHYKISFLPDSSLKESVNRPYSHLEPVELDAPAVRQPESTNEEEVVPETKQNKTVAAPKVNAAPEKMQPEDSTTTDATSTNTISEAEDLAYGITTPAESAKKQKPAPEEELPKLKRSGKIWWFAVLFVLAALIGWSWISNSQKSKENQQKISEMELIDSLENASAVQEELALNDTSTSQTNKDSIAVQTKSTASAIKSDATKTASNKTPEAKTSAVEKTTTNKAPSPEVQKNTKPATKQKADPKSPAERTVPLTTAPPDSKKLAQIKGGTSGTKSSLPPVRVKAPTVQQTSEAKKGLKSAETAKIKPGTPATQNQLTVKPKAKNTSTSGTATYVTMEPGNRLTLMALKYYGHKAFWVYIYQENKSIIANPDNVPAGTRIRIPKADPALINANDPALISKAQALQSQILNR